MLLPSLQDQDDASRKRALKMISKAASLSTEAPAVEKCVDAVIKLLSGTHIIVILSILLPYSFMKGTVASWQGRAGLSGALEALVSAPIGSKAQPITTKVITCLTAVATKGIFS